MTNEPVDRIPGCVLADVCADLFDDAREIAPKRHRELVLSHPLQHPGGDRCIGGVHRRGLDAHEYVVGPNVRFRQVVAEARLAVEAVEREGAHLCPFDPK